MGTNINWTLGRSGPTRSRIVLSGMNTPGETQRRVREQLSILGESSANVLRQVVEEAYPSVTNLNPYHRWTNNKLFAGLTIKDRTFFWREWDTRPHWPPFGKNSSLYAWTQEHGMGEKAAFFIARRMAPEGATDEIRGGHRMTVSGLGGYPSIRTDGRLVATRGKYALTDALQAEAEIFAAQAASIILFVLENGVLPNA